MAAPSLDSIKDTTEKVTTFVEWLAEIWRGKNWVKKLLLIDAFILVVFNPLYFPSFVESLTKYSLPDSYKLFYWAVVGLIFLAALIVAIRAKPKPALPAFDQWIFKFWLG